VSAIPDERAADRESRTSSTRKSRAAFTSGIVLNALQEAIATEQAPTGEKNFSKETKKARSRESPLFLPRFREKPTHSKG
jgi:hypothetical protein